MKIIIAFLLAFFIGAMCRWFGVPVPAPPTILGVALILAITLGYMTTDTFLAKRNAAQQTAARETKD